jgi:NADH-quinone oxidoreductase subunit C
MALEPAVTDLEQLKDEPALACLLAWNAGAVEGAKKDRGQLAIWLKREAIREAAAILRDNPACPYDGLIDVTCVDWLPQEPRFEVTYQLLSYRNKTRVTLKVLLSGDDPALESVTSVWPASNFYEREVMDLFGVRFGGHPNPVRIMMPEDWEGHPLRKDYPVEGYR